MKRVTLRELAGRLGVTPMAVSMALRNHPRVSAELRARAQALARELGYVPNPAWSRRSSQARGGHPPMPLAMVVQLNPIWPFRPDPEAAAIREVAARMGYRLTVYEQGAQLSAERLARVLWQTGVEAVLLGPLFDEGMLRQLPWHQFSVVAFGAGHVPPPCHWVVRDAGQGLVTVAEQCWQRGYRRVALLQYREPRGPADAFDRESAMHICQARFRERGGCFEVFDTMPFREAELQTRLRRFRPDAIIGQTPRFYFELRSHRWPLGEQIGFAAWMLEEEATRWNIAGCSDVVRRMAEHAMRLLDAEVRAFERGLPEFPVKQLVPMRWIEGNTLPPRAPGREVRRRCRKC